MIYLWLADATLFCGTVCPLPPWENALVIAPGHFQFYARLGRKYPVSS